MSEKKKDKERLDDEKLKKLSGGTQNDNKEDPIPNDGKGPNGTPPVAPWHRG